MSAIHDPALVRRVAEMLPHRCTEDHQAFPCVASPHYNGAGSRRESQAVDCRLEEARGVLDVVQAWSTEHTGLSWPIEEREERCGFRYSATLVCGCQRERHGPEGFRERNVFGPAHYFVPTRAEAQRVVRQVWEARDGKTQP